MASGIIAPNDPSRFPVVPFDLAQYLRDTGRETLHYDRVPDAYRNIPGFMDVANDRNANPGKYAQDYLESQRAQGRTDESDAVALSGYGYLGGVAPQAQPPAAGGGYGATGYGGPSGGIALRDAYANYTDLPTPSPYQPFGEVFQAPEGTMDPWTQTFGFDVSDLESDPGYQFLREQGIQARQRAAAANGTLNNPGLAQELEEFGQGLAGTHLGEAFGRALNTYNTNYDTFAGDRNRRFGQALQGYQTRAGVHNQNEAGRFGAATSNWTNSFNMGRASENDAWDRQFRVADYGLAAANSLAGSGDRYGAQGSDIIQNQGNARASGQVGGANAWNNAYSNIADFGQAIPYLRGRVMF